MSATGTTSEAPHTVLVHVNLDVPHGVWEDLLEGLYETRPAEESHLAYDEWAETTGRIAAANRIADEVAGAIAVGTDEENTPILCESRLTVPLAEEV